MSIFPFEDIDIAQYNRIASRFEKVYGIKSLLNYDENPVEVLSLEGVVFGLLYLENKFGAKLDRLTFVDTMGNCCRGVLYASTFGMLKCVSIEINGATLKEGRKNIATVQSPIPEVFECFEGSMQDYFPFHADVAYLDVTQFQNTMLDEGILMDLFFRLGSRMLPGSFLLLTGNRAGITPAQMNCPNLELLTELQICKGKEYQATLCIYKVANK